MIQPARFGKDSAARGFFVTCERARMNITFEEALPQEAQFLTSLAMDSNASYRYRSVSDEDAKKVLMLKEECFHRGVVIVMKEDGVIIGFFSLCEAWGCKSSLNELTHLFLAPPYIGKGYGRLLFQEAMRTAKEKFKWKSLQWESDPFAAGFYLHMGAVQVGSNPCRLNPQYRSPLFSYQL